MQDFDTVRAKENVLAILREELRKKTKTGVIATGSMSDPYNPFEEKYQLTRQALELVDKYHFGIAIATKSDLIARDIDILSRIKEHSPVIYKITVTTIDDELSKKIEPTVCVSSKRLEAIRKLSDAGLFTGVLMMPILPFLSDTTENVLGILYSAHQNGAKFVYPLFGLTLRTGQREYFYQKLEAYFPGQHLKQQYIKLYGSSYECHSPKQKELRQIFTEECKRLGMMYKMKDIMHAYRGGYDYKQLSLFQ
ncbi:MAG: SPL family radical SAM protein [Mobilitalea sp.]